MKDKCTFCTIVKPTNTLVLGTAWLSFCERCGDKETFERMTDVGLEIKSIRELFDDAAQARINKERAGS